MKPTEPCPPIWRAVGAVFATPVIAAAIVFFGVLLLLAWPIIPFFAYRHQPDNPKPDEPCN